MKNRKIYNRISILRKGRGISRKELARKIGVNFQTVGYLEREEYNPSLDLAFRISEFFNLPIDMVFSTKPMKSIEKILMEKETNKNGKTTE
ncbi:MAG: helix-turn-helix domain-containing protein [Candidatus Aminicenantes bacterium]|nr:helix-turn-helix domain-containing protein [Candidatus Aminicenantes bacterium]